MNQTCSACADPVGSNFKCKCTNWMTCGQRASADVMGCHHTIPYMLIKVRECKQGTIDTHNIDNTLFFIFVPFFRY